MYKSLWSNAILVETTSCHKNVNNNCAVVSLESVSMAILGTLMKTKQKIWFTIVLKDRQSRLVWAVTVPKKTASHAAVVLLENWIIPYGSLDTITTDNGLQFELKLLVVLCAAADSKLITSTEYNLQASGQVKRFYKMLVARLRHYINKPQTNRNFFVQPLIWSYTMQLVWHVYVKLRRKVLVPQFI